MSKVENIFENIPNQSGEEFFQDILNNSNLRIERIISTGQSSPDGFWYDQEQNEWVMVLKGSAAIEFEGDEEIIVLNPGDYVLIPSHKKHRVAWTSRVEETIWLAIYY